MRPEGAWIWESFWLLSPSRQMGMRVGRIGIDSIFLYADGIGMVEVEEKLRLTRFINALDAVYVEVLSAPAATIDKGGGK